ncbi:MAG: hypothetical protein GX197_03035 [Firmicutes bacterium]|nr:hypothetical protein [Bacillota bacterium]
MGCLLWLILFVLCWPVALLFLILYPLFWLILLPFRFCGYAVTLVLDFIWQLATLPLRLLRRL